LRLTLKRGTRGGHGEVVWLLDDLTTLDTGHGRDAGWRADRDLRDVWSGYADSIVELQGLNGSDADGLTVSSNEPFREHGCRERADVVRLERF